MRIFTRSDPATSMVEVIAQILPRDIVDLSSSEAQFTQVLSKVMNDISTQIAAELLPQVKEHIMTKIDIPSLVQEAAVARVQDLLFPKAGR